MQGEGGWLVVKLASLLLLLAAAARQQPELFKRIAVQISHEGAR